MNANQILTAIGEELKVGFFVALSEEHNIELEKIIETWDSFFGADKAPAKRVARVKKPAEKAKTEKDEEKPKKASGVKTKTPQGKTTAISRDEQTPVQFSSIDKLKVADLKALNKERGLPISGNKAILTDALKTYEKAEGAVEDDDDNKSDDEEQLEKEKKKRSRSASKKKDKGTKDDVTIVKNKKKNDKETPPVIATVKPEELRAHKDKYGNIIVAGDLVCEEQDDGTRIVVGYVKVEDDDDSVYELDTPHMEKCKELNLDFKVNDTFDE